MPPARCRRRRRRPARTWPCRSGRESARTCRRRSRNVCSAPSGKEPHEVRQPQPAVADGGGRGPDRRRLVPGLLAALRPRDPVSLQPAVRADDLHRRPPQAGGLHPLRALQPLVALRVDPRHVVGAPRRRRRVPDRRACRLPHQSRARIPGAARRVRARPAPAARLRRRGSSAGAHHPRAPRAPSARRTRERGAHRRGRGRRPADRPRDAAQPGARLHADRHR